MKYIIYRNVEYTRYFDVFEIFYQIKKIDTNSENSEMRTDISKKDVEFIGKNLKGNRNIKIDRDFSFSYWTDEPSKKERDRDINIIKEILKQQEKKIKKNKKEKIEIKI